MPACKICNHHEFEKVLTINSPYLGRDEKYPILRCAKCAHALTTGRMDDEFLSRVYDDQFHNSSQQSVETQESPVMVNARRRVGWLHGELGLGGKLLDIGAGTGAFVEAASKHFNAIGIELSAVAVADANRRGINIVQGNFLDNKTNLASFDIVTLWDVIASLKDPVFALNKCNQMLNPGGKVILTFPMVDSLSRRLLGRAWPLWIPPVNLHWFSENSVAELAERTQFTVEHFKYDGKQVSLRFLLQKIMRSFGWFRLESAIADAIPTTKIYVNTRDILTAVLSKNTP